jgi:hypothetical protein
VALVLGRLADLPLGWAAACGALLAAGSLVWLRRWDRRLHARSGGHDEVLFPSP